MLGWLLQRGAYDVDPTLADIAQINMQVKLDRGASRLSPEIGRRLAELVA